MKVLPAGPQPADIMIVGEAPGVREEQTGMVFCGTSGQELTRMLHEAGINRSECRVTNVTPVRPPGNDINHFFRKKSQLKGDEHFIGGRYCTQEILVGLKHLRSELAATQPKVIIALGDTALWALTGNSGIGNYRGSLLHLSPVFEGPFGPDVWVIPTYHPAAILRQWSWRFIAVQDLRRARRQLDNPVTEPQYSFLTRPSFTDAIATIRQLRGRAALGKLPLAIDIETRGGFIDCIGIAWSETEAISIPLAVMSGGNSSYFTFEEELQLLLEFRELAKHPNVEHLGQNYLYDMQYFAKEQGWYRVPVMDTMLAHATCFPGLPKSLDYLSSLYLDWHQYWKNESKEADKNFSDEQRWVYNCKDCVVTYALREPIQKTIDSLGLQPQVDHIHRLFEPLLFMMFRGVRFDGSKRDRFAGEIMEQRGQLELWFQELSGAWTDVQLTKSKTAKPWYASPTQQQKIFYEVLGLQPVKNRKTGRPTADDAALEKIAQREPLMIPVCDRLAAYRSLGVFFSTFVEVRLSPDRRIRCSYNPVGTETFRFSSSEDAFGHGLNLQNIPKGNQ